jgi:hypothetical protein
MSGLYVLPGGSGLPEQPTDRDRPLAEAYERGREDAFSDMRADIGGVAEQFELRRGDDS